MSLYNTPNIPNFISFVTLFKYSFLPFLSLSLSLSLPQSTGHYQTLFLLFLTLPLSLISISLTTQTRGFCWSGFSGFLVQAKEEYELTSLCEINECVAMGSSGATRWPWVLVVRL